MTAATDVDVVIVGCGPVGLTTAILLGQLGRSVTVLERWPEPYPLPRAVHFDHEVGRILQSCGIGDELRASTEPAEIYEWRNAEGVTLLRFGRIGDSASGWPESSMFHQPALEALLEYRAGQLASVEIRRGVEVVGLDQTDDGVVVRGADDNECRARFAIGCDGANSTVRTLADLPMTDLGFFYDWLIVDVILDEPRPFVPLNLQVCDPERPTTAVSGGPGRRRWEFMRLPHESRHDLDEEARVWGLLADWDVNPKNAQLERHAVYTFGARYAEQWRSGRVLLAGDAAHLMPPNAASPHAGHLFVRGTIDGEPGDDASGVGWRLVTDLADPIDDVTKSWFETIGGRVVHLAEPDATYRRWFDEHKTHFALQRPDFQLYGTATTASAAAALLDDLRRQLTSPTTSATPPASGTTT